MSTRWSETTTPWAEMTNDHFIANKTAAMTSSWEDMMDEEKPRPATSVKTGLGLLRVPEDGGKLQFISIEAMLDAGTDHLAETLDIPVDKLSREFKVLKKLIRDLKKSKKAKQQTNQVEPSIEKAFSFMDLPLNVRNRVYFYAFAPDDPATILKPVRPKASSNSVIDKLGAPPGISLLMTSWAVYKEAVKVFYDNHHFDLRTYSFRTANPHTSYTLLEFARSVTVELDSTQPALALLSQLQNFKNLTVVQVGPNQHKSGAVQKSQAWATLWEVRELMDVTIVFMGFREQRIWDTEMDKEVQKMKAGVREALPGMTLVPKEKPKPGKEAGNLMTARGVKEQEKPKSKRRKIEQRSDPKDEGEDWNAKEWFDSL